MVDQHGQSEEQIDSDGEGPVVVAGDPNERDWFLGDLTRMANNADGKLSFGITLNVGGVLVSGMLVGGAAYFKGFGRTFASGLAPGEDADEVAKTFAQRGEMYAAGSEGELRVNPAYIHLANAQIFLPGAPAPSPTNQGVWWRGRIAAVDGFFLGTLSQGN